MGLGVLLLVVVETRGIKVWGNTIMLSCSMLIWVRVHHDVIVE